MNSLLELRGLLQKRVFQLSALSAMLVFITKLCIDWKLSVLDYDTWWHLRTGDWIVDHLAVPHTGIFSRTAANHTWAAYSWGFEVLLSRAYHSFGLMGIGVFGIVLTLVISYTAFCALRHLSGQFWLALLLSAWTLYTFLFVVMPRPVYVSIICYIVLITVLLQVDREGDTRRLRWLPLLFLLWANFHIQFIYGLFILTLFAAVHLLPSAKDRLRLPEALLPKVSLSAKQMLVTLGLCFLATLINPYGLGLYKVVFEYSKAKVTYDIIVELQPLTFRTPFHFSLLLLTAIGFLVLGRQKRINVFHLALLLCASVVGFRTVRDCWFLAFNAAALIAVNFREEQDTQRGETWLEGAAIAALLVVSMFLFSRDYEFNEQGLQNAVASKFPVGATDYLRRNQLPAPLYNSLDWGGFLIWALPEYPVAIDGRNDLYGDKLDTQFYDAQNGKDYLTDVYLGEARCILLPKRAPLAAFLKFDSRYALVYEDTISAVFTKREAE